MSSRRQQETGTAQVHGRLGAGLPQLPPPVHTVVSLAAWHPAQPAEVTGTSAAQRRLPRFGIAVPQAGNRRGKCAAAGSQRLRGGRGWECSLVGAGGTQGGPP